MIGKNYDRYWVVLVLILLLAFGIFFADVVLLPGVILPGPPYFVPVIVAAYFLPPRKATAVAVFATLLRVLSDLAKQTPDWLMLLYFAALVIISVLSVLLSAKLRREAALAEERKVLLAQVEHERQRVAALAAKAQRQAAELQTIIENIADAVFVCDQQGRITLANHAGLAIFGAETQETLGTLSDYLERLQLRYLDGRPVPLDDLVITRALKGEVSHGREEIATDPKTRRHIDLLISAAPLRDEEGQIVGAVAVATDITRVKELAEVARHRAAELEVANKELQSFAYSVAHDLRAPARQVTNFSQLLLNEYSDKPLDDRGKKYLEFLRNASQKEGQLIDDLLELSRVTRAEIRREAINLSEIARTVMERLHRKQPDRQVELIIAPEVVANGDPQLLRIVLENLLGNAWKFTSTRPVARIEFGATRQDQKSVYYVKDNGIGFDMAYVGKLFGAFQRLHRADEFPGTGIGLAMVERIVQRHGGRVRAEGEIDKGAAFYFTLG